MFRKPFHVKSNVQMKNSEKRKLRDRLIGAELGFDSNSGDNLWSTAFANKGDLKLVKIVIHSEESVDVFSSGGVPLAFDINGILVPSLYLTWKIANNLHTFLIQEHTLHYLENGADLMLPGILCPGAPSAELLGNLPRASVCAVSALSADKKSIRGPLAIGLTWMSSQDMVECGMKGRGVQILHLHRDCLWASGPKTQPPVTDVCQISQADIDEAEQNALESQNTEDVDNLEEQLETLEVQQNEEEEQEEEPEESMDSLLYRCFLAALKYRLDKNKLPFDTGTFYSACLLPCLPQGKKLDMRKTSYKKWVNFLQQVNTATTEGDWIVQIASKSKGVDVITEVNWANSDLKTFKLTDERVTDEKEDDGFVPPQLVPVLFVTAQVLPILKQCDSSLTKGRYLAGSTVRKMLTDYVKVNELQSGKIVKLDPHLSDAVRTRAAEMNWVDLFNKFSSQMTDGYEIQWPDGRRESRRGQMPKISLKVERRASNKHVTLVDNLGAFGIEPELFAKQIRLGLSCGTSLNQGPANTEGMRVEIQGNQIKYVGTILKEEYAIDKKFVVGLELAKKGR